MRYQINFCIEMGISQMCLSVTGDNCGNKQAIQ
jgi:hypothetical protein